MELTDLEICKRIAEIEGVELMSYVDGDRSTFYAGSQTIFNPLKDDELCFQLMVKYKITVEFTRYFEHLKSSFVNGYYENKSADGAYVRDKNPSRAILLAIIEANK